MNTAARFSNYMSVQEKPDPGAFLEGIKSFVEEIDNMIVAKGERGNIIWLEHEDSSSSVLVMEGSGYVPDSVFIMALSDKQSTTGALLDLMLKFRLGPCTKTKIEGASIDHIIKSYGIFRQVREA